MLRFVKYAMLVNAFLRTCFRTGDTPRAAARATRLALSRPGTPARLLHIGHVMRGPDLPAARAAPLWFSEPARVRELPRKRALTVRPLDGVHAVLLAAAEPLRGGQRSDTRLEVHRATEHLLRVAAAFKIHCARGPRRRVRERAGGMGRARAAHPSCLDLSGTARHESPMT